MALQVIWTPRAQADLLRVMEYLEREWSIEVLNSFLNDLDDVIALIKVFPPLFRRSGFKDVHEAVISKHNVPFYRVKEEVIYILAISDPSKDPIKRPYPPV